MDSLDVAAEEPGELPRVLAILAGTVHAVVLTTLNRERAAGGPLVVVTCFVARHLG